MNELSLVYCDQSDFNRSCFVRSLIFEALQHQRMKMSVLAVSIAFMLANKMNYARNEMLAHKKHMF